MTRAISRRIRCLRKHPRNRIINIGLLTSNDQDPSILEQRRGMFLSRDGHEMSYLRELTRPRIVQLCCFQQWQSGTLFASRDQNSAIRE